MLAVAGGILILSFAGVLIANAAGAAPTALQIPPWKMRPPSMAPPGPPLRPTGSLPPFSPAPAAPCGDPGFTLPTGIEQTHQGPFDTHSFVANTRWRGLVGSDTIAVYAGSLSSNGQGTGDLAALRLYEENETANHCGYDENLLGDYSLSGHKALTIMAVSGTSMTLRTDDGLAVTFDLQARNFK